MQTRLRLAVSPGAISSQVLFSRIMPFPFLHPTQGVARPAPGVKPGAGGWPSGYARDMTAARRGGEGSFMRGPLAGMALALGIGVISGAVAALAGLPLPWMLGPMIGNTLAALLRIPVRGPARLRPVVIPVIGVMLGSAFSPEILSSLGRWSVTLLLLPPFIVAAGAAAYGFYRLVARYDPITAFYSAMPGGLTEMLILGTEAGGVDKRIALAHATRIFVVVTFVVGFFGFALDVETGGTGGRWVGIASLGALDIALLLLSAVAGAWLGARLKLPASNLLGPMILSAALHLIGWVTVPPPSLVVIVAQVAIGTIIGCRFAGTPPAEILRDLGMGAGASLVMLAVALVFALGITATTGEALTQSFLAFSPGGLTEMSLLALAMGKDVAYISIAHTARIAFVVFLAPWLFRFSGLKRKDRSG